MIDFIPDIPYRMDPDFCQEEHGQEPEKIPEKEAGQKEDADEEECINLSFFNNNLADIIIEKVNDSFSIEMEFGPDGYQFFYPEKKVQERHQHYEGYQ